MRERACGQASDKFLRRGWSCTNEPEDRLSLSIRALSRFIARRNRLASRWREDVRFMAHAAARQIGNLIESFLESRNQVKNFVSTLLIVELEEITRESKATKARKKKDEKLLAE